MNRPIPEAILAVCPENARRPSRRKVPPNAETDPWPLPCPHRSFLQSSPDEWRFGKPSTSFSSVAIRRPHLLHQSHMCELPQVVADGPRSLAKPLADTSYGLLSIHPQCSKNPHTNRTCHGPKSIGIGYGYCGIFSQPCFVWDGLGHCKGLLSVASYYIQIICTIYF